MAVIKILQTPVTPTARDVHRCTWSAVVALDPLGNFAGDTPEWGQFRKGLHPLEAAKLRMQNHGQAARRTGMFSGVLRLIQCAWRTEKSGSERTRSLEGRRRLLFNFCLSCLASFPFLATRTPHFHALMHAATYGRAVAHIFSRGHDRPGDMPSTGAE
ncbi:hypothetical protein OsJ_03026 [Oryza sativa Japonica Group]|uniref:Uncharacterized protein n=1 Tax=Oryza sativa subsp. japonica TaxID=39947 RepID=B9EYM3_ORYSJ|nr:hypothetical protein OsJ_03026 [Oryza sativa Japonica Group]